MKNRMIVLYLNKIKKYKNLEAIEKYFNELVPLVKPVFRSTNENIDFPNKEERIFNFR